jgi:tetratricopeptide (TPR) repeat protein
MGRPECVKAYLEAFDLATRLRDNPAAAVAAFNLGHAYMQLLPIIDLDKAERWVHKGLDLLPDGDRMHRSGGLGSLGLVAYERFLRATRAQKPEAELVRHLNDALHWYLEALKMTPPDAVGYQAVTHAQLGILYGVARDLDRALHHYSQALRLEEGQGDLFGAAQTRCNVAVLLAPAGRFADALEYAKAALRGFQTFGPGAAEEVQQTLALISAIAKAATA